MPYKNLNKKREYQRDWVRQKRSKGSTTYPVQPNYNIYFSENIEADKEPIGEPILIDADGNPVYEP